MAKTKIQFQYSEIRSFEEPLTISMEVPERSIEEMCEYFQRFLSACGYIFEEGENIQPVRNIHIGSGDETPIFAGYPSIVPSPDAIAFY